MTFEDFNNLNDEEKKAAFNLMQDNEAALLDAKAELASFVTDNKGLEEDVSRLKEELVKTKELNFSLARKLNVTGEKATSAEDIIHNMFGKGEKQ